MLGRTAASLYWMSRYNERAQNVARLLDATYRTTMVPHTGADETGDWQFALQAGGCRTTYEAEIGEISPRAVMNYLLFDERNPSSVRSCIETARNNARSVRTAITTDMWESINSTWLEFADTKPHTLTMERVPEFLIWVVQRCHLFRGALLNTILRDDGYYFSQLGHFLEKADNTARIVDTRYWILLPDHDVGGDANQYQWSVLLRTLGGIRSYHYAYHGLPLKAFSIAEFLLLRKEMPRSLSYCYDWINETMEDLCDYYGEQLESFPLATTLYRDLKDTEMRDIFSQGLHDFLLDFTLRNNAFSNQLAQDYHFA